MSHCPLCLWDTPDHDPHCPTTSPDRPIQALALAHLRLLHTLQPILDASDAIPALAADLNDLLTLISDDDNDPPFNPILN